MKKYVFPAIFLFVGFSAYAEDSLLVQKSPKGGLNVFVGAKEAEAIYNLLAVGVPADPLPQGQFLEGGNFGCAKLMMGPTPQVYCAYHQSAKGLTTENTPTFNASVPTVAGQIQLVEMKAIGILSATITGKAAEEIYNISEAMPDARGRKIAKNQLCSRTQQAFSCFFTINQRGFADFPETKLAD